MEDKICVFSVYFFVKDCWVIVILGRGGWLAGAAAGEGYGLVHGEGSGAPVGDPYGPR